MYGKISIYLAAFSYLLLPFAYFVVHILKRYAGLSKEIELLMLRILMAPVFLVPLFALAIIILGYRSKVNNESYGVLLNISIILGILSLLLVFFAVHLYIEGGGSIGGIR